MSAVDLGLADELSELERLLFKFIQLVHGKTGTQLAPQGFLIIEQDFRMFLVPPYGEGVRIERISPARR